MLFRSVGLNFELLYQQLEKEFEIQPYVHTFEDLAINTVNIYFEPRPKPVAEGQ